MRLKSLVVVLMPFFLFGCAEEMHPLTVQDMITNQTTTYSNENGEIAHHIWCRLPQNCLLMAGELCSAGYTKYGEHTTTSHEWSFAANRWYAGGGSSTTSTMQLSIVCKNAGDSSSSHGNEYIERTNPYNNQ